MTISLFTRIVRWWTSMMGQLFLITRWATKTKENLGTTFGSFAFHLWSERGFIFLLSITTIFNCLSVLLLALWESYRRMDGSLRVHVTHHRLPFIFQREENISRRFSYPSNYFSTLAYRIRPPSYILCKISAPSHAPSMDVPKSIRQTFNKTPRKWQMDMRRQQWVCYKDELTNISKT